MTARTYTPQEEKIIGTAVSLYRACAAGVAGSDVRDGRMTRPQADDWTARSVADFAASLRELGA